MVCTLRTINRILLYVTADHDRTCCNVSGLAQNSHVWNTIPYLCLAHNSITVCYLTARAICWTHPHLCPRCNTGLNPALRHKCANCTVRVTIGSMEWIHITSKVVVPYRAENTTCFCQVTDEYRAGRMTRNTPRGQNPEISFSVSGEYAYWPLGFRGLMGVNNGMCAVSLVTSVLLVLVKFTATGRSEAWVCGRSLARIAGSNPGGVTDICFL
jgi:hypothetical protein